MVPLSFQGLDLKESCWVNGTPFSSGRAIGELLEYEYPNQAIRKIVERNPHINNPQWSVVVRLTTTDGKEYETRVYSPIGVQLIMFESRQPKARAFKVAVANFVWAYMNGQLKQPVDPSYTAQLRALDLLPRGQKGLAVRVLAQAKDCSVKTICTHRAIVREGRDPSRKRHWTSINYWDRRYAREKALVVAAMAQGWSRVLIWREALGSPVKPSLYMVCALAKRLARTDAPVPMTIGREE
jgi:hypothetical protein